MAINATTGHEAILVHAALLAKVVKFHRALADTATIGSFLILATLVCACAPRPFKAPSVIAGSDRTVSIEAGQATDPSAFAERYCARFGKRAIYIGATELSDTDLTNIYAYDCVEGHR